MNEDMTGSKILKRPGVVLWGGVILAPLVFGLVKSSYSVEEISGGRIGILLLRTFVLSAIIAGIAVVLGMVPGKLLGTCRKNTGLLWGIVLLPLLFPRYVLYYAWGLLLGPTTWLGKALATNMSLARAASLVCSCMVLVLWYWPAAALMISQGWRRMDRQVLDSARLDAGGWSVFLRITLPMLKGPLALAFAICFVLSMSEFTTFHLAGVETIGTELAVLHEMTGKAVLPAGFVFPVVATGMLAAIVLKANSGKWEQCETVGNDEAIKSSRFQWICLFGLIAISLAIPFGLLLFNVRSMEAFKQFITLHSDDIVWSVIIAITTAGISYIIAAGVISAGRRWRAIEFFVHVSIFVAMFLPASVLAGALLKMLGTTELTSGIRQSWVIVSVGHAMRFTGIALIVLLLNRSCAEKQLSEMAAIDGASRFETWRYVHFPRSWPLIAGTFLIIVMFSISELPATMILLPAGVPSFAQRLLNQMHYAYDQQVIASCIVMLCLFSVLAATALGLMRLFRLRTTSAVLVLGMISITAAGCERSGQDDFEAEVIDMFGRTGRGRGEFVYPRAIDITQDGNLFVVDKTARLQLLDRKGKFLREFRMPDFKAGKPVGITVGPEGNLYVADTHYHRVVMFTEEGEIVRMWGEFGEDDGQFIYPTDVEFAGDGRIFVSEYGGNDRVNVFDKDGKFMYKFGRFGEGQGELSRPSALCVDHKREILYVADACNHRIAVYNFNGGLIKYIGSAGTEAGKLRYPYDLDLMEDGTIVVCEYGNNRIQLFSPEGESVAVYGGAGRAPGRLAYPWAVTVDKGKRAYIVDSGSDRIQIWQL